MSDVILRAESRKGSARKVRYEGFVPGVIYGRGIDRGVSVKFEELELNKVIRAQGLNPRMEVFIEDEKTNVLIKEVQRHPVRGDILHVDLQAIAVDEVIRTTIPVIFIGREVVEAKQLTLEVQMFEIEVSGPANIIPDSITLDVSELEGGDTVTMEDVELDEGIEALTSLEEVLAVVSIPMAEEEEETEDDLDLEDMDEDAEDGEEEEEEEE